MPCAIDEGMRYEVVGVKHTAYGMRLYCDEVKRYGELSVFFIIYLVALAESQYYEAYGE
jgi:hypothetical protein